MFSLIVIFVFAIQILPYVAISVPEDKCSREGGMCGPIQFCPKKYQLPGLCPKQQSKGIDCCRINPVDPNDKTCGRKGGECTTEDCEDSIEKGSVCPPGQKCCIWLT